MGQLIWEAWENSERKTREYFGLFCFLGVTYAIYLGIHLGVIHAGADPLAKLCLISALPFAVLTYADAAWCSSDAGPVCVAAWVAASITLSFKCPICVVGLAVTFFPFVLSALLAHGLGAACRFLADRIRG